MIEVNVEGKDILWSEHPQEAYVREYKGFSMGIGDHPGITNAGIWNLTWLLTPTEILNQYLMKTGRMTPSIATELTPYIIGTSWQLLESKYLVAMIAAKLTPLDFLDYINEYENFNDLILSRLDPHWVEDAREKALTFSGRHLKNIVQVNFGGGK